MSGVTEEVIGVVGAGSFGTTIATLLGPRYSVLLYSRNPETVARINRDHQHLDVTLPKTIQATSELSEVGRKCKVIFPVVPSDVFRSVMVQMAPFLEPYHILIHGTKGFDVIDFDDENPWAELHRSQLRTMSEVIVKETRVVRTGCLSGPNLHKEILSGLPAASVIASEFDEVIVTGHRLLNGPRFKIYGSDALLGTEIAGAIKNMIAIGSGIADGLNLGKNVEAFLVTRGLREMILIGESMGADHKAFFGLAGIGDLIVTATSALSRNYSFGQGLARGLSQDQVHKEVNDLVEGVRTIKLMLSFARTHQLEVPLVEMLHAIIYCDLPIQEAMSYLLEYPYSLDVDFLK